MKNQANDLPKPNLYLVDSDHFFTDTVKKSIEKKFGDEINVNVYTSAESSIEAMKKANAKPHVVVMDHTQNKTIINENNELAVKAIRRISPEAGIVILSNENNKDIAENALAQGAHNFVTKDQFALDHINTAVAKCLHPVKM